MKNLIRTVTFVYQIEDATDEQIEYMKATPADVIAELGTVVSDTATDEDGNEL